MLYVSFFLEFFSDERKMDHVLQETERNRQMANQIAYTTFAAKGVNDDAFPTGPKVCLYLTVFSPRIVLELVLEFKNCKCVFFFTFICDYYKILHTLLTFLIEDFQGQ